LKYVNLGRIRKQVSLHIQKDVLALFVDNNLGQGLPAMQESVSFLLCVVCNVSNGSH